MNANSTLIGERDHALKHVPQSTPPIPTHRRWLLIAPGTVATIAILFITSPVSAQTPISLPIPTIKSSCDNPVPIPTIVRNCWRLTNLDTPSPSAQAVLSPSEADRKDPHTLCFERYTKTITISGLPTPANLIHQYLYIGGRRSGGISYPCYGSMTGATESSIASNTMATPKGSFVIFEWTHSWAPGFFSDSNFILKKP